MIIPSLPPIPDPFDDPRLKKELLQMAKAFETHEKKFAALKPQVERQFRHMSAELARSWPALRQSRVKLEGKPSMKIPSIPVAPFELKLPRSDQLETIIRRLDEIDSTLGKVVILMQEGLNRKVQTETSPTSEGHTQPPSKPKTVR